MKSELVSGAAGLWVATLAHKAAVLGFSFWVGHTHGAEGVGVMASVLAISWMVSTVAGWGLPDRAPFLGSAGDSTPESRRLHGIFFLMILGVHAFLLLSAGQMAGVSQPELTSLATGLVLGSAGQSLSAVGFSWRRGAGLPRGEIIATITSSLVLGLGALFGADLGMTWALSGLSMWLGSLSGGDFLPARPRISDLKNYVRQGTVFLCFGLGAWVLGNIDILLARVLYPPEFVGELQVGTMAVRGMAMAPWLAATFMLRPTREAWLAGGRPHPWSWALGGGFVGALVAGIAWIAMPFLARGHAMPVASIEGIGWTSMLIAPTFYATVLLLPLSAQWHMRRTLRAIGMGLMVQVGVGWAAASELDVASLVVVAGVGQLVTLMWLIQALRSDVHQGFAVDRSALSPGELVGASTGERGACADPVSVPTEE